MWREGLRDNGAGTEKISETVIRTCERMSFIESG
jgi:hypothetical protein